MKPVSKKMVLLTKEILHRSYLPISGRQYWQMPNLDELARKGTVFLKHYTTAPSTAMAVTGMFSGLSAYLLKNRKKYSEVERFDQVPTLFDTLQSEGYTCHVLWSESERRLTYPYTKCYGNEALTVFHELDLHGGTESKAAYDGFLKELDRIAEEEKTFLWIHLPHVIFGTYCYGEDMEQFDSAIGAVRERFGDDGLTVSADHGNMNLRRGVAAYGFHVYDDAIRIPLISPRLKNGPTVDFPTSHTQMMDIFLNREVKPEEFVFSDTQYYLQPQRKLAIIKDDFKYIYRAPLKIVFKRRNLPSSVSLQ